jgi:GNAT superfamily N-acetyltransferase
MSDVVRLTAGEARAARGEFVALLQDVVHDGASVGFLRPLPDAEAGEYWDEVFADVERGGRVLLAVRRAGRVVGSAQLGLCGKANGRHRAEVQKVIVHPAHRRHGLGRALMAAVDREAATLGKTTLFLDSQAGMPAERMYPQLGWTRVGEIPEYATCPDGKLVGSVYFYKLVPPAGEPRA